MPRTRRDAAKNFKSETFTISPSWVPRGLPSDHHQTKFKGRVFQWDPCKTIHYRINPGAADPLVIPFTQEAVLRLQRATGFTFKYVGTTSSVPLSRKRYPKGTDLVVAWSHQDDYPILVDTVGRGGPAGVVYPARRRSNNKVVWAIQHMGVTMNMASVPMYPFAFESTETEPLGAVLQHELGHAVGLAHFADGVQVMDPTDRPSSPTGYHADYEAGDLAGLQAQGAQGGCLKPYRTSRHGRSPALGLNGGRDFMDFMLE